MGTRMAQVETLPMQPPKPPRSLPSLPGIGKDQNERTVDLKPLGWVASLFEGTLHHGWSAAGWLVAGEQKVRAIGGGGVTLLEEGENEKRVVGTGHRDGGEFEQAE